MRRYMLIIAPALALALSGCLAKTAVGVVTAPVRAAGQVADWATTSQDEADRNRGREIRAAEERYGRLSRKYEDLIEDCDDGDDDACREAVSVRREMDELSRQIPAPPPEDD